MITTNLIIFAFYTLQELNNVLSFNKAINEFLLLIANYLSYVVITKKQQFDFFFISFIFIDIKKISCYNLLRCRGIAQFGSALGSGPRGRRFKSCCSDHMRVQLNGRAPAFQAGYEGSIPFTRSILKELYSCKVLFSCHKTSNIFFRSFQFIIKC